MLKPTKRPEKSVAPADASNPMRLTGCRARPKSAGSKRSRRLLPRSSASWPSVSSDSAKSRTEVSCPKRLVHSSLAVCNATNAFGAAL